MAEPTLSQIVAFYRKKAKYYETKADDLEQDFGAMAPVAPEVEDAHLEDAPLQPIVDFLKSVGAKRPLDIAEKISVLKDQVIQTVNNNPEIFEKAERGWIKLKEVQTS